MFIGISLAITQPRGNGGPFIGRTASSFPEDTASGTTVATLSVANHPSGSSGWTFAETADPDNKFNSTITAGALKTNATLDYETKTSHSVTITASKSGQTDIVQVLVFQVTNVLEVTLNALTGTFSLAEDAAANDVAGALSGKTSGSTLSLIDDAGGRVDLSGTNIVRGGTALDYETAPSHSFTVRETHPDATTRDTILTLTVTDVSEGGGVPSLDFSIATNSQYVPAVLGF